MSDEVFVLKPYGDLKLFRDISKLLFRLSIGGRLCWFGIMRWKRAGFLVLSEKNSCLSVSSCFPWVFTSYGDELRLQ